MTMTSTLPWQKNTSDIKELTTIRQKVLDKKAELLYNIRRRVVTMKDYEEVNPGDISVNQPLTELLVDVMKKYATTFDAAAKEAGNNAVVAGGAVRDILLGYKPKDLDVFITDVTDDLDDENVYFSEVLRRLDPETYHSPFQLKAHQAYTPSADLCVYGYIYGAYPVDVMTTSKTLEETLEGFDHDLVQCYMKDGKYFVSPNFLSAVKANRVASRDLNTHYRLKNWKKRTGSRIAVGLPPKGKKLNPYMTGVEMVANTTIWEQKWIAADVAANEQLHPADIRNEVFNMRGILAREVEAIGFVGGRAHE